LAVRAGLTRAAEPFRTSAMNYRHAFHAGNHADLIKHLVLLHSLAALRAKPAAFAVLDAFAGAGAYALDSSEAQRSPEWRDGVGRLLDWQAAPAILAPVLDAARAGRYPGSPALILEQMRADDRLLACDLHPEEFAKLRAAVGGDARAHLHRRDGFQALPALLPFAEKRGLILLDPPYEKLDEVPRSLDALKAAVHRFRQGVFVWWRPEKPALALDRADRDLLAACRLEWLRVGLAVADPSATSRMVASSVMVLNPPFGLREALQNSVADLAARLAIGPGARAWLDAG
jgi:23S rRNA (adenine2030-N6)-methyltransferase